MSSVSIAVKMPPGDRLMRFDLDPNRPYEVAVLGFFQHGKLYETEVVPIFAYAAQSSDTILDIRSNIGLFSVLAAFLGPMGA